MITSAKQFQRVLQIVKLHEKELKARREVWASKVIQRTFTKWWSYKSLMPQMNTVFDEEFDLLWYRQWEPRTHWDSYWEVLEQEEGIAESIAERESRY
jgi:hypothetical protein